MAKQKKLTLAIVGTGGRGVSCFGTLLKTHSDCEIAALVDTNHVRCKDAAEYLKIQVQCFPDIRSMLKKFRPDGVVITTPDVTHRAIAVAALNAGCNVLLDKPLATKVSDCQKIIHAAEKSRKIMMMGFNLRHHPVLKRLKEIIDGGRLGRIFMIENREFYGGGRTYMARWNRHYAMSGGLWIHKGSHDFDVFQWLLDFPKPARVSAFAGVNVLDKNHLPFAVRKGVKPGPTCSSCPYFDECPDRTEISADSPLTVGFGTDAAKIDDYHKDVCIYLSDKDVHDNGIAIVEYENGSKAVHSECFIGSIDDRKYTIYGDRGTAEVSLTSRTIVIYPRWSSEAETIQIAAEGGTHGGADPHLVDAFLRTIRKNEMSTSTAEQGMWSTACGEAAELSWREHRMVEIAELFGKK